MIHKSLKQEQTLQQTECDNSVPILLAQDEISAFGIGVNKWPVQAPPNGNWRGKYINNNIPENGSHHIWICNNPDEHIELSLNLHGKERK